MAIEYSLTLAGATPAEEVAQRALPGATFSPYGATIGTDADILQQLGFDLTITGGTDGYVEARGNDGTWVWDPNPAAVATFRLASDPDRGDMALHNVLEAATRILATAFASAGPWSNLTARPGGTTTGGRTRSSPADSLPRVGAANPGVGRRVDRFVGWCTQRPRPQRHRCGSMGRRKVSVWPAAAAGQGWSGPMAPDHRRWPRGRFPAPQTGPRCPRAGRPSPSTCTTGTDSPSTSAPTSGAPTPHPPDGTFVGACPW